MIVAQQRGGGYARNMKSALLCALAFCLIPGFATGEIYRSVDEHGNVVYSDQPGQNGKKVDLPAISTYKPQPIPPGTLDAETKQEPTPANATSQLSFVQPGADETIFDNQGNVAVALRVEPPLQPKQRLALKLDDNAAVETAQPTYQLSGVDRGTHTLQAWIVGANGHALGDPTSVTFHLRQASRLFRNTAPKNGPVQQAPRAPTAPNVPKSGG